MPYKNEEYQTFNWSVRETPETAFKYMMEKGFKELLEYPNPYGGVKVLFGGKDKPRPDPRPNKPIKKTKEKHKRESILVYVAHPYGGDEENILKVEDKIREFTQNSSENITYLSPIHNFGFLYNEMDYDEGLDLCLRLLSLADILVLCDGWASSEGCKVENLFARDNNIWVMTEDEWKESKIYKNY